MHHTSAMQKLQAWDDLFMLIDWLKPTVCLHYIYTVNISLTIVQGYLNTQV